MRNKSLIISFIVLFLIPLTGFSQTVSDYLILQDMGSYKLDRPEKMLPGRPPMGGPETFDSPGVIGAADHFSLDHTDKTYKVMYIGGNGLPSPTVKVTKHSSSDSDKWLLHEVEDSYRNNDDSDKRLGLLSGAGVKIREIAGNKFIYWGLGGGSYTWISGQKVIEIKYTDLQRTKPEPIEVIQAYLQKHPSTITSTFVFDQVHDVQWIKDEMDRRLWLCDKWFYQLQLEKVQQNEVFQQAVKSMNVFLDYREKYYGIKAVDEKNLLSSYLNTNNGTGIKAKLKEYKDWWALNKDKAITLS